MLDKLSGEIERKDYKDLLTEDCTLIVDTDTLCFNAAQVSEETKIKVINKSLGWEQTFKNRTEFKGRARTKGKIGTGSFLDDWNTERVAEGLEPLELDSFEIEDVQETRMNFDMCKHIFHNSVEKIKRHLGVDKVVLLTGGVGVKGFREELPLAVRYKGNRKAQLKPIYLRQLREYISSLPNSVVCGLENGEEADDYVSIYGYAGYKNYRKTGKFNYIVASLDKDNFQCPCLYFYYQRSGETFTYPTPFLIEATDVSIGNLEMKKGMCKGYGMSFLCTQWLLGDYNTDHFSPFKTLDFPKNFFGEKKCYELLSPCETPAELLKAVKKQYYTAFPDGVVRYPSWDGKEMEIPWHEYADMIFKCLYMKRSLKDDMNLYKLFRNFGVSLNKEVDWQDEEEGQ